MQKLVGFKKQKAKGVKLKVDTQSRIDPLNLHRLVQEFKLQPFNLGYVSGSNIALPRQFFVLLHGSMQKGPEIQCVVSTNVCAVFCFTITVVSDAHNPCYARRYPELYCLQHDVHV
ncbi:hypothetical protein V6N11_011589 [Hibiscus sabdariffa]|uniref:Uncharacterized protein n=1 Tax=Hibiscus sabdariffa TaxID=183260 RepID=A0ABR2S9D8_9ROSI